MATTNRRRRYDTRRFQAELEKLSTAEIRARLNSNRIRSLERRALAEEVLRQRAAADTAETAAEGDIVEAEAIPETGAPWTETTAAGAATGHTMAKLRKGVTDAFNRARRQEVPSARRLGRVLGTVVVVGGAVAIVAGLLRR